MRDRVSRALFLGPGLTRVKLPAVRRGWKRRGLHQGWTSAAADARFQELKGTAESIRGAGPAGSCRPPPRLSTRLVTRKPRLVCLSVCTPQRAGARPAQCGVWLADRRPQQLQGWSLGQFPILKTARASSWRPGIFTAYPQYTACLSRRILQSRLINTTWSSEPPNLVRHPSKVDEDSKQGPSRLRAWRHSGLP